MSRNVVTPPGTQPEFSPNDPILLSVTNGVDALIDREQELYEKYKDQLPDKVHISKDTPGVIRKYKVVGHTSLNTNDHSGEQPEKIFGYCLNFIVPLTTTETLEIRVQHSNLAKLSTSDRLMPSANAYRVGDTVYLTRENIQHLGLAIKTPVEILTRLQSPTASKIRMPAVRNSELGVMNDYMVKCKRTITLNVIYGSRFYHQPPDFRRAG
ncbi:unnamed protein product [Cyclocybe aegerita]|uniref:Uncharacterized protein n=1 Tax=Cyclocybe aegerita TaxID=1973307 RepID=A0A8S0WZC6_CYCAE|nr:unnamed protein product [Cyclocybe aegerita]